ncbi:MAG TPA: DUF2147 domain-containing protein [Bacteroidia bacterium]|nr:DUF2147 domain-containing protein [Bacteroidia bacterium]
MKTVFMYAALTCMLLHNAYAQKGNSADALTGTWLVQDGTAKVKIEKAGDAYAGKIVWLKEPADANGKPKLDVKNPAASLQGRPVLGLPLLKDFVYDEDNLWTDGTIYDPDGGKTYSCKITMLNNQSIEVRGYVGISLFGRTETWKRCADVTMN